jgi:hypothetical protein
MKELIRKLFGVKSPPLVQNWATKWPNNGPYLPPPPNKIHVGNPYEFEKEKDWGGPFIPDFKVVQAFKKGDSTWKNLTKLSPRYEGAVTAIRKVIASGVKLKKPVKSRSAKGATQGEIDSGAIWSKTRDAKEKIKLYPDSTKWPKRAMEQLHPAYAILEAQPAIKQFSLALPSSLREANLIPIKKKSRKKKTKKRK